jgi:hypothetical protein
VTRHDHDLRPPTLPPGELVRSAIVLFILGGGALFFLIREVFF